MAVTIQIENNSMAANGWLHVEPDLVVLTSSTSAPQEVDDAIRQFKSSADSPQQDHQTVRALIQRILSATGASSSAVWFPAADEGVGDSHLHLSGSVRVEGVEMGKRFSLSSQGSPHLVVPVVSECEELWIGLAGAERSVEMGRERSSGVFGGSAFLVHPRASGTWNLDSDVSSADAPPVVSERPPAEAQDTPEVSLAPSEESGSDTGDEAEPSSPDEVQPKAGPDPDAPQALDGESFPVSASQPSEPIDDENAKESAPLAASVVTPMGETLLQVPTSRVPEGWLAPDSDLVDGIQCPNGHLNRPDVPQGHHCRWCGRRATEGTRRLVKDRRPALGQLKEVSTSKEWPLTRSVVLGRAPSELLDLFGPGGEYPQPSEPATMVIADEHDNISRAHALIRLDGWQVFVRDLGSLNQTRVRFADGRVISLDPGTEYPVEGRCKLFLHDAEVDLNLF